MFTAEQYRAKATEYGSLLDNAPSPDKATEFRELKQSYLTLARNMEWLTANRDKTVQPRGGQSDSHATFAEQENILRCLGAAVIEQWNTIPTGLQRELFEHASTIGDVPRSPPLKEAMARFLHDHKDDAQQRE